MIPMVMEHVVAIIHAPIDHQNVLLCLLKNVIPSEIS